MSKGWRGGGGGGLRVIASSVHANRLTTAAAGNGKTVASCPFT